MGKRITESRVWKTVGLDVGDRKTFAWILDESGEAAWSGTVATSNRAMAKLLGGRPPMRIVLEASTHSHWLSWQLEALGHEVVVANPRRLQLISKHERKCDARDARLLAELGHTDASLSILSPVQPKSQQQLTDRSMLILRSELVKSRTALVLSIKGIAKAAGHRLPRKTTSAFHKIDLSTLPATLAATIQVVLEAIREINEQIAVLERKIEAVSEERYPATAVLRQVNGVGPITALLYVLTIGDPRRFEQSRDVGAYVGLAPGRKQSGDSDPPQRVTRAGDRMLRSLLIQCAHYALGPFGKDSDLRRFGQRLEERGGAYARRRAVVATARKLAVLLHRLWRTSEVYEPLRNTSPAAIAEAR